MNVAVNSRFHLRTSVLISQLPRCLLQLSRCHPNMTGASARLKATKAEEEDIDLDAPIKFSTSRAATWKARDTYGGSKWSEEHKRPWYEPIVVSGSMAVFLLYFCYFRQESDVDTKFGQSLYDHITGLEEKQLEMSLQHSSDHGKDTVAIKKRLEELRTVKEADEIQTAKEDEIVTASDVDEAVKAEENGA